MIKVLSKTLLILSIIVSILIFYLSFFGISTTKLNKIIIKEALIINPRINLELKSVKLVLIPFDLTINIKTVNPKILIDSNELKLAKVTTNISLKSLLSREFSIDNLSILTKDIKLSSLIALARIFKNSGELFLLDKIVKGGSLIGDIKINFDREGKIKDNYQINGSIINANIGFLNKNNLKKIGFLFKIKKNEYFLSQIESEFKKIKFSSPFINVKNQNGLFLVNGNILTKKKNIKKNELDNFFKNKYQILNIEKINFSSESEFSFNLNKRFKFKDLSIKSTVNLNDLYYKNSSLELESYFPNFKELIKLRKHKLVVNYTKDRLDIIGKGEILLEDKNDTIDYRIIKQDNQYNFDSNINLNKNSLAINFLNYAKKSNIKSLFSINGLYRKSGEFKFNNISLKENNNKFLIKELDLNNKLKITSIGSLSLDYINMNEIKNKISLKKNKNQYFIEGQSFDATELVNNLFNDNEDGQSIFDNFNSTLNVKLKKTHLNTSSFINNLSAQINFKNNKINNLILKANGPNEKKITSTIITNKNNEKITTLFTDFPEPIVERFKFIKGFEEGVLDYYSINKNGQSNSVLKIYDFKIKEVPIFAKLLSLASLQGIADLLTGEGIRFSDLEMNFSNTKGLMTINELYALGPAVSILMEGYIQSEKLTSLRGTLVPATTINKSIASIPLLGDILVGKKVGEGVFGVSFKIKGPPNNLKTIVNPIKTLTPRFITRTLKKIKKN